ncbi:MAG TPA: hypothetical protein VKA26_02270 [Ignavibacteriaceae bacterium]|nr:hypothetical protein [Ignavibacteriaceae bacterium]
MIFITWFGLLIVAIINGTIRDFTYQKKIGEHKAHQLSTVTLLIFMSVYCYFIFNFWKLENETEAIIVGFSWLILTLAFEFLFGRFVRKKEWKVLFKDYNIFNGRLWILIPLWTVIVPYLYFIFFN